MREKLIELLAEHCAFKEKRCVGCDEGKYYRPECKTNLFGKIADHLIANGVTVQEWISVSEPPKEKGTYIVCTDKGGILLGHWYGKEWNVGGGAKKHLAYWMKKPEPQKGE